MAPSATVTETYTPDATSLKDIPTKLWGSSTINDRPYLPLQSLGSLKEYKKLDLTPIIGTQFSDINLSEIIRSPEADLKIKDLAILSKLSLSHFISTSTTAQLLSKREPKVVTNRHWQFLSEVSACSQTKQI